MSCNLCTKPFSLLRKEKGCPNCGFSFCSKCLDKKMFVPKLNTEAKVCMKCYKTPKANDPKKIEPPDAYYKRIGAIKSDYIDKADSYTNEGNSNNTDQEIQNRLRKLKEDKKPKTSDQEIAERLQKIKGETPKVSESELQERLAKLRGVPLATVQSQPVLLAPDTRTEQEQADDLMKQYLEQTQINTKYKEQFDGLITDIESRLGKLKGTEGGPSGHTSAPVDIESEDEEETARKIVEKVKAGATLDDELSPPTNDELPFCEICNEDAKMRCLGCHYLFCKRCFLNHKDDDDGCNKYEPYTAPKNYNY